MNRRVLWAAIAGSSAVAIAFIVLASRAPQSRSVVPQEPTPLAPPPPSAASPADLPSGVELARIVEDLGAPPSVVAHARAAHPFDPSALTAYDLVWISRARGTARRSLIRGVAELVRPRLAKLPDRDALGELVDAAVADRAPDEDAFSLGLRWTASHDVDADAVRNVGSLVDASRAPATLDFDWLLPLSSAAGHGSSDPLARALLADAAPVERPLGIASAAVLDAERVRGASDEAIDTLLSAHADATGMRSPLEGLQPIVLALLVETQVMNGGFAQLRINLPDLSIADAADGYERIGFTALAAAVRARDDEAFWEQIVGHEADVRRARAAYVRRLLGATD